MGQPMEFHAFFLGVMNLFRASRTLGPRPPVDAMRFLGAESSETRNASIAVLPAPITATRRSIGIGVSKAGKSRARIKLQRVRSSLADSTPLSKLPKMPGRSGILRRSQ